MIDITKLNDDIARGYLYYSDLIYNILINKSYGINTCINEKPLYHILLALKYELLQDIPNNEVLEQLQICLLNIIGEESIINNSIVYYGFLDTKTILSQSDIITQGISSSIVSQLSYVINLNSSQDYKYVWVAELLTEPLKTTWEDTVNNLNRGNIGTDQDLFSIPQISGLYRVYITEYKTIFSNPIEFN